MSHAKPAVGVIGGTGLYHLDNLKVIDTMDIDTPWGKPSSPVVLSELQDEKKTVIAFIARHGQGHRFTPSRVPYKANIAALKALGVQGIVAFSAVGSLREEIRPGDIVLPSQFIDRTKGDIRPYTYFDGSIVAHAMMGEPVDTELYGHLADLVKQTVKDEVRVFTDKTLVVMEGPQFSTRAESHMYRQWGGDIIGMTTLPEAKLAREAELPYAIVCTSTDYDAWRVDAEPVTVEQVVKTLHANSTLSKKVAGNVLAHIADFVGAGKTITPGSMKYAFVTDKSLWDPQDAKKYAYILPDYFKGE